MVFQISKRKRRRTDVAVSLPSKKSRINFDISVFKKQLQRGESIQALETIVKHSNPDILVSFLNERGVLEEIAKCLKHCKIQDHQLLTTVFSALHVLLSQIVRKSKPEQIEDAETACRYLLNNHLNIIHLLLGTKSDFRHKKSALQLLTVMVSMSKKNAKDVLSYLSLETEVVDRIIEMRKPEDPQNLRTCFIHFLMAFLVHGCPCIARLLLNKRLMLTSIFPMLKYDAYDLVVFVLTTLRTNLVELADVPKTLKVHAFNTRVICQMIHLYNWKGPANFKMEMRKKAKTDNFNITVNKKQQRSVAETAHKLLLTLCTSHCHGIVFSADSHHKSTFERNPIIYSVLKDLKQPWENSFQADLFVQIVKFCPGFANLAYSKTARVLHPNASVSWIKALDFIIEIVLAVMLQSLTPLKSNIAEEQKNVSFPQALLKDVASPGLLHKHPLVRLKTIKFLNVVLQSVCPNPEVLPSNQAKRLQDNLAKILPGSEILSQAWDLSFKTSTQNMPLIDSTENPNTINLLLNLVDVMLLYLQLCPNLLCGDTSKNDLSGTVIQSLDLNDSDERTAMLQIQVLFFFVSMDASILKSNEHTFTRALTILLDVSIKAGPLSEKAKFTLGTLLTKWRVLEPAAVEVASELNVWLQCCQAVSPSQRTSVLHFLHEVINNAAKKPEVYIESTLKAQAASLPSEVEKGRKYVKSDLANQIFEELLLLVNSNENLLNMKKYTQATKHSVIAETSVLSVLLMSAMDFINAKKMDTSIVKYLSNVFVHLLYMQQEPKYFLHIVKQWKAMPSSVMTYFQSWTTREPTPLTEPFGSFSLEASLSHALLEPGRVIPQLQDISDPVSVIFLWRLVLFHIAQMAEMELLTESVVTTCLQVFEDLLNALQESVSYSDSSLVQKYGLQFLKTIFQHHVLLQYFSPMYQEQQIMEKLVTNLFLDFLALIANIDNYKAFMEDSTIFLRERLFRTFLSKPGNSEMGLPNTQTLLRAVKALSLTESEKCDMIWKLSEEIREPWTELLCYLLKNVKSLPSQLVTSLGYSILEHLNEEKDSNSAIWGIIHSFAEYFQKHPWSIHHLPNNLFEKLVCKEGFKLASIILEHNESALSSVEILVKNNKSISPTILFPLLDIASNHGSLPSSILVKLYKIYQKDILEMSSSTASSVFANHPNIAYHLVVECMDAGDRKLLCNSLSKNFKSFGVCSSFQLSVIHGLQVQGSWKNKELALVQLLISQIRKTLETRANSSLVIKLCLILKKHLKDTRVKWNNLDLSEEDWKNLPELILRKGLNESDYQVTQCLFSAFSQLIWRFNATEIAACIFERTIAHSCFLDIILVQEHNVRKLSVLQLLLTCGILAPQTMSSVQIPIWLGAYGASLSHSDQIILKILKFLDYRKNVNIYAYRPFVWGEAAINHYSVRKNAGMSLWRIPQATIVLELIQPEMVERTLRNFPSHRKLFCENEDKKLEPSFICAFEEELDPSEPDIYDPSFIIPVFNHVMAPESDVREHKFIRQGGLALTIATLGSECSYMRTAALTVISRYYNQLKPQNPSSQLHEQLLESLRGGLYKLKSQHKVVLKRKSEKSGAEANNNEDSIYLGNSSDKALEHCPKVPNISAIFFARASVLLTQPENALYLPLHKFVQAKTALELHTVPELLKFFRSASMEFRTLQIWLLETIQYGMKTYEDVQVAGGCYTFKLCFTLFSCSLSDSLIKILILRFFEATLAIPAGITHLKMAGLVPWLHVACSKVLKEEDSNLIIAFIKVFALVRKEAQFISKDVVSLFLKIPPLEIPSDVQCVLQVALESVSYLLPDHLLAILQICQVVVDKIVIDMCSFHLGFGEEMQKYSNKREVKNTALANQITSVENTVCNLLKHLVHTWQLQTTNRNVNECTMKSNPKNVFQHIKC